MVDDTSTGALQPGEADLTQLIIYFLVSILEIIYSFTLRIRKPRAGQNMFNNRAVKNAQIDS